MLKQTGRPEIVVGWYHSHPGYGCWLSGIDVSTQMLNQNFQEPFVAIVVDPVRTISGNLTCLVQFLCLKEIFHNSDLFVLLLILSWKSLSWCLPYISQG